MAYQMKDSPHKRGVIEGTDSALKLVGLAKVAVTKGKKIYKAVKSYIKKVKTSRAERRANIKGETYRKSKDQSYKIKEGTVKYTDKGSTTTKYFGKPKLTTNKFADGITQEVYESPDGILLKTIDRHGKATYRTIKDQIN